jgi:trehalose-6-phosphate synthase
LARLVVVSNRVGIPDSGARAGGLEVSIRPALRRRGGVWFGWSGEVSQDASACAPTTGTVLEARELGGATEALVWVVARDQRGGEAVDGPHRVVFSTP